MSARALFIGPDMRTGGAERQWLTLLTGLRRRGVAVRLLCLNQRGSLYPDVVAAGIPTRGLASEHLLARAWSLLGEVRGRPDVIVSRGFNGHAAGLALGQLSGAVHVLNWHRYGRSMSRRQRAVLAACARAGDHAIVVSAAQRDELRTLGFPDRRVHLIHNGVPDHSAVRRNGGGRFTVLLVANLRPEKRIDRFLEAITLARADAPEIAGIVCGDGPSRPELEARGAELGSDVQFLGHRSDVATLLSEADALCLTSEAEALPMVILEAMAAGLPVVATDVGGVREAVDHGVTGHLVPVDDPHATARALVEFARDPIRSASMGRAGRSRQLGEFSVEVMLDRYAGLLEELAA